MKNNNKRYYDVAIIICVCLISGGIPFSLFIDDNILVQILNCIARLAFIVFYFFYIKKQKLVTPKLTKLTKKDLLFIPFIILAFSNFIYCWITNATNSDGFILVNVILGGANCLLVAISEELTFRSLLVGEIVKDKNKLKTILLSSAIFGALHLLNISSLSSIGVVSAQAIYTFALGILLSLTYLYSDNIILPIILHFAFNFINGTLVTNIYDYSWNLTYILVSVIIGIIILSYAILVYYIFSKKEKKNAS